VNSLEEDEAIEEEAVEAEAEALVAETDVEEMVKEEGDIEVVVVDQEEEAEVETLKVVKAMLEEPLMLDKNEMSIPLTELV